jgi:hypothetical protein
MDPAPHSPEAQVEVPRSHGTLKLTHGPLSGLSHTAQPCSCQDAKMDTRIMVETSGGSVTSLVYLQKPWMLPVRHLLNPAGASSSLQRTRQVEPLVAKPLTAAAMQMSDRNGD